MGGQTARRARPIWKSTESYKTFAKLRPKDWAKELRERTAKPPKKGAERDKDE